MQDFIDLVEKEFIRIIIGALRKGSISQDDAKEYAREFLILLPFQSEEDIQEKIKLFTEKHDVFVSLYLFLLKSIENHKTSGLLNKMRDYMKSDKIEETINLVKQQW